MRISDWSSDVCSSDLPRATVMQKTAAEVLEKMGVKDPVFDVARELEHIALNDPYFIDKKPYQKVDLYSGIILSALGFPTTLFTVQIGSTTCRERGWQYL